MQNPDIRDIERMKQLHDEYEQMLAKRTMKEKIMDLLYHLISPHMFLLICFIIILVTLTFVNESNQLAYIQTVTYIAVIDSIVFTILHQMKRRKFLKMMDELEKNTTKTE